MISLRPMLVSWSTFLPNSGEAGILRDEVGDEGLDLFLELGLLLVGDGDQPARLFGRDHGHGIGRRQLELDRCCRLRFLTGHGSSNLSSSAPCNTRIAALQRLHCIRIVRHAFRDRALRLFVGQTSFGGKGAHHAARTSRSSRWPAVLALAHIIDRDQCEDRQYGVAWKHGCARRGAAAAQRDRRPAGARAERLPPETLPSRGDRAVLPAWCWRARRTEMTALLPGALDVLARRPGWLPAALLGGGHTQGADAGVAGCDAGAAGGAGGAAVRRRGVEPAAGRSRGACFGYAARRRHSRRMSGRFLRFRSSSIPDSLEARPDRGGGRRSAHLPVRLPRLDAIRRREAGHRSAEVLPSPARWSADQAGPGRLPLPDDGYPITTASTSPSTRACCVGRKIAETTDPDGELKAEFAKALGKPCD